jgi:hypothetical protein
VKSITRYYYCDQLREKEMMGGFVTDMGENMNAEMHTGFCWGTLEERDHFEGLCVGGRIILKWFLNI